MALFTKLRTAVVVMAIATVAYADSHAGMSMDDKSKDADERLATLRKGLQLKFVHWFISVAFLVVTPAFGACYALADRFRPAVGIQAVAGVYSIVEALVLRFPDPQGHENRTSRGTAWFLMLFYALVVVNGAVCEGASMAAKLRDSRIGRIASRLSPMSYKVMSVLLCECGFLKAGMNIIAMLGFCYNDHTGQCNAHGIMGMSFIAYGLFLATMVVIPWLRVNRHRYSQEMYDSAMITAWGIVNTFTEHRPWQPWSHHDYQHTSMGIIFWACGMLGMFLSRHHKRKYHACFDLDIHRLCHGAAFPAHRDLGKAPLVLWAGAYVRRSLPDCRNKLLVGRCRLRPFRPHPLFPVHASLGTCVCRDPVHVCKRGASPACY